MSKQNPNTKTGNESDARSTESQGAKQRTLRPRIAPRAEPSTGGAKQWVGGRKNKKKDH